MPDNKHTNPQPPRELKPYCPECENDYGILWFDKEYRGNRLRGAEIASRHPSERFATRCPCGGSYRQPRPEKHYTMQDVMRLFHKRQEMRAAGQPAPPISQME